MAALIELSYHDGVSANLRTLDDLSFANAALMAGALALKNKVAVYPPSRSRPGRYSVRTRRPMGWYKRGTGWMEPVVRDGRAVGYINRRATSESFGKRWTVYSRRALEVAIGNNASYGPWVKSQVRVGSQGPQSRLLRAYGWSTIEEDATREAKQIAQRIERALAEKFGG